MRKSLTSDADEDKDLAGHLTAVLTAEFLIFDLTRHTPLRYNPFLPHWVNTAAKIQRQLPAELIPWQWQARLEMIRMALSSPGVEDGLQQRPGVVEKYAPDQISKVISRVPTMIDLRSVVKMMELQGLPLSKTVRDYLVLADLKMPERNWATLRKPQHQIQVGTGDPKVQDDFFKDLLQRATQDVHHKRAISQASVGSLLSPALLSPALPAPQDETTTQTKGKAPIPQLFPITSRSSLDTIAQALSLDPEETSHALSRLPLDLASLDLLTRLLDSPVLTTHAPLLNPKTLTREYIQHCLRILERTGNAFSPSSDSGFDEQADDGPRGREEQIRGVKLLVMFMRCLLGKGRLPVEELRFDIEEICVRYLWVPEVREFRRLIGGDGMIVDDGLEQGGLSVGG